MTLDLCQTCGLTLRLCNQDNCPASQWVPDGTMRRDLPEWEGWAW